jgi:hypothetical protein
LSGRQNGGHATGGFDELAAANFRGHFRHADPP